MGLAESICVFCLFLTSNFIFISLSEFLETISSTNPIVNTLFPLTGTLVSVSSVILSSTESLIVSIAPLLSGVTSSLDDFAYISISLPTILLTTFIGLVAVPSLPQLSVTI